MWAGPLIYSVFINLRSMTGKKQALGSKLSNLSIMLMCVNIKHKSLFSNLAIRIFDVDKRDAYHIEKIMKISFRQYALRKLRSFKVHFFRLLTLLLCALIFTNRAKSELQSAPCVLKLLMFFKKTFFKFFKSNVRWRQQSGSKGNHNKMHKRRFG